MTAESKHITILCSRLDLPGGIERVVVNTANLFTEKGHKVRIIILDQTKECFYPIYPEVKVIQYPVSFGITKDGNVISRKIRLLSDVLKLRKLLKGTHTDLILATEYPFAAAAILARSGRKSILVSWEHHHFYELKRNNFWEKMFRFSYPKLDYIVCLNEDEQKLFLPINRNTVVIPNFIRSAPVRSGLTNKTILTVGRLAQVKGIDLLIQAAKIIFQQYPDWKWKIIGGDGTETAINQVIRETGLSDQLIIQTPVDHELSTEYQMASLYVMTSRNECFPMTLLEAQSSGLPCIAFNCETGPRHIIVADENGLLVEKENPVKLAEAVISLIRDEEQRKKMGENAYKNVSRFSPDKVYELWRQLLEKSPGY